jgi:hypothetical protein
VELLDRLAGQKAAFALRAPFVLGNRGALATLFEDSGIEHTEITTHQGRAQFPSLRVMVEADLRGWLPVMGVNLTEEQIAHIVQEAEQSLGSYVTTEGRVAFDTSVHLVKAIKH